MKIVTNIIKEAKSGTNKFLILATEVSDDELNDQLGQCADLKKSGYKALHIDEKFTKTGMDPGHKLTYSVLCSNTHNDLMVLIKRHPKQSAPESSVVFNQDYSETYIATLLHILSIYWLNAMCQVYKFFNSPMQDKIRGYLDELITHDIAQFTKNFSNIGHLGLSITESKALLNNLQTKMVTH